MINNISIYDRTQTKIVQAGKFIRNDHPHASSVRSRQSKTSSRCLPLRPGLTSMVYRFRGNQEEVMLKFSLAEN